MLMLFGKIFSLDSFFSARGIFGEKNVAMMRNQILLLRFIERCKRGWRKDGLFDFSCEKTCECFAGIV